MISIIIHTNSDSIMKNGHKNNYDNNNNNNYNNNNNNNKTLKRA